MSYSKVTGTLVYTFCKVFFFFFVGGGFFSRSGNQISSVIWQGRLGFSVFLSFGFFFGFVFWAWPGCQDAKTKVAGAGELWGESTLATLTVPCGWPCVSLLCWHLCAAFCGPVMGGYWSTSPWWALGRTLSSWVVGQWPHTPFLLKKCWVPIFLTEKSQPPHQTLVSSDLAHCRFSPLHLLQFSSWSLSCCFGFPARKSPVLSLASELEPMANPCRGRWGRLSSAASILLSPSLFSELQASCLILCNSYSPLNTGQHQYQDI